MKSLSTRSKLEHCLMSYVSPIHNIQSLKLVNVEYTDEQISNRSGHGVPDQYNPMIDNMLTILKDGRSSGYLYNEKHSIKLRYKSTIEKSLFQDCCVSYSDMENRRYHQPIQSLVAYLDCAEDLGIDFENLSCVLQYYVEEICPSLNGQMMIDK